MMMRSASYVGLIVGLFGIGCAGNTSPRAASGGDVVGETCSTVAEPDVDAATQERLEGATNVLAYENVWRDAHPGTTPGSVGGSEVRARIRANAAQIRGCYESALDRLPAGGGRVIVRFVIDSDGTVPTASISSNELQAPDVGCCVAKRVAQWTFPPTTGGFVVVEYPFVVRVSREQ